jgi:hypothetical protein
VDKNKKPLVNSFQPIGVFIAYFLLVENTQIKSLSDHYETTVKRDKSSCDSKQTGTKSSRVSQLAYGMKLHSFLSAINILSI